MTNLAAIRARARDQHEQLLDTCREMILSGALDLPERLELSAWLAEGRRLLAGDQAPEAGTKAPGNVRGFVRVLGPFIRRASPHIPKRELTICQRSTAQEFAAAHELPDGPEAA